MSLDYLTGPDSQGTIPDALQRKIRAARKAIESLVASVQAVKVGPPPLSITNSNLLPSKVSKKANLGGTITRKPETWKAVGGTEGNIKLAGRFHTATQAEHAYSLEGQHVARASGDVVVCREPNMVPVEALAELLAKAAGTVLSEAELRSVADTGRPCAPLPNLQWLHDITHDDAMVDTFSFFHPEAQGRFTCWEQYTNGRCMCLGINVFSTVTRLVCLSAPSSTLAQM